jgi:ERCC4-type nuclease
MLIKIDFRETELYSACEKILQSPDYSKINVKIVASAIPLGDIIICDEDEKQSEKIMIERKTLDDLAASIRDGRYAEQSFRLNACSIPNHNIFYAIEGDLRQYKSTHFSKNKIDKKALLSAMVSIHYYKGFSVMRTINVVETAEWIIQMADKIQREELKNKAVPYYNTESKATRSHVDAHADGEEKADAHVDAAEKADAHVDEAEKADAPVDAEAYVNVVKNKRIKKDNVTPQNIGEIMLSQIPGVSANVAIAVMKKFGTLQNLIESLKNTEEIGLPLKDITLPNEDLTKKPRKLNKTNIANIYMYLLQKI